MEIEQATSGPPFQIYKAYDEGNGTTLYIVTSKIENTVVAAAKNENIAIISGNSNMSVEDIESEIEYTDE